jgi:hypothetical protein
MPKLSQLTEVQSDEPKYTTLSPAVNLFQLMVCVENGAPLTGPAVIDKRLSDLINDNSDNVDELNKIKKNIKSLTTAFTNVKRKPTQTAKTGYFNAIFSLLLPIIGETTIPLNISKLTTLHAKGKDQETIKKSSLLVGKAILHSKKIKLKSNDLIVLKAYGVDDNTDELPTSNTPLTASVSSPGNKKLSVNVGKFNQKTTEELESIVSTARQHLDSVVRTEIENSTDLTDTLKTNEDPSVFHVSLNNENADASDTINQKITNLYAETKNEYGVEIANFVGKFMQDVYTTLDRHNGYLNTYKDYIRMDVEKVANGFTVRTVVGVPPATREQNLNDEMFFTERTITTVDNKTTLNCDKLQFPYSGQDKGFNKVLFKKHLELYKSMGIDEITLEANVDIGGYAWFRYGFVPDDRPIYDQNGKLLNPDTQINGIGQWINNVSGVVQELVSYASEADNDQESNNDFDDFANHISNESDIKVDGVQNFIDLALNAKSNRTPLNPGGKIPENKDGRKALITVIGKFFSAAATEFKAVFKDPKKHKNMCVVINNKHFKPITFNGKNYTMSYKALLSIQSMRSLVINKEKQSTSRKDRLVPFNSMQGNIYINWRGVLDMKDLENTYLYLSAQK